MIEASRFIVMESSSRHLKIVEVIRVGPSTNSDTDFTLPLTFYDILFMKTLPTEILFFYRLPDLTPHYFNSVILPKLKHALSLTLNHYIPLSGNLIWPPHAPKPFIHFTPTDTISLTIAESDANFDVISSDDIREAAASRHLSPELTISEDIASVMSLQITLFPNKGICIGCIAHHAAVEGKTGVMFMRAWAYLCKQSSEHDSSSLLPEPLIPFYDRTSIKDPADFETLYLNYFGKKNEFGSEPTRSLKLWPNSANIKTPPSNSVRASFVLTCEEIKKLREKVLSEFDCKDVDEKEIQPAATKGLHISTFALTFSYTSLCLMKTRLLGGESNERKITFYGYFAADLRMRLDPPLPPNYFGNCLGGCRATAEARVLMEEKGLSTLVEETIAATKKMEKAPFEGLKIALTWSTSHDPGVEVIVIFGGSNRFQRYEADFGWGRPNKVEVPSIDRNGSVFMMESRDGNGGVEISLALDPIEMNRFASLFHSNLKNV